MKDLKESSTSMYLDQNEKIMKVYKEYRRIVDNEESNSLTIFNKVLGTGLPERSSTQSKIDELKSAYTAAKQVSDSLAKKST